MNLCISEPGMIVFSCPCSRIRIARMLDMLRRPRIAGRFSSEPSATLAECAPSLAREGFPAESPLSLHAILQCSDSSQVAAPCPAPDTRNLFVRFSFLTSCPWGRDTGSNVCAVFTPMILLLLPMSNRIVSMPSNMVPLFDARANSWCSPNIPGASHSVAPCMPLRRLCSSTH
eukprot:8830022-Pyramimonas_sp.AAC.1